MKWLAEFFGNKNGSWVLSGIITFLYFGISHFYQRSAGMVSIVIWSLIISVIFYHNRKNLGLLILIHGLHDTYGLTLLYLDIDGPLAEMVKNYLSTISFLD